MPNLQEFLDSLPASEKVTITEPINLDFGPTALVLELEAQKRFPVICIERPDGFDVPVVTNLFADRNRIARDGWPGSGRVQCRVDAGDFEHEACRHDGQSAGAGRGRARQ